MSEIRKRAIGDLAAGDVNDDHVRILTSYFITERILAGLFIKILKFKYQKENFNYRSTSVVERNSFYSLMITFFYA